MADVDRCTGHCCQNFSLSWSPEELRDAYRRWQDDLNDLAPIPIDIHLIYPMVFYLGDDAPGVEHINEPVFSGYRYRCKHWDPATRDCTIYEIRPQMCRDYPGEAGCNYAACTWQSSRQKPC